MMALIAGCITQPEPVPPAPVPAPLPEPPPVPPKPVPSEPPAPRQPSPPQAPSSGTMSYYQDRQEQQLRERLTADIRLSRSDDTLRLVLPGNAAFTTGGDQLQPRFAEALTSIAAVLKEYRKTSIDIRGYTDSTGSFEYNQQLSVRRAQSVARFLGAQQIDPGRIRATGYGPRNPVADNRTDAGRHQNRRVEIDLVPAP